MEWYVGLAECEIDCDFSARNDFRKLCFLLLYRHVAFAIENSPELIAPKSVHRNIVPGFYPQIEGVPVVFRSERFDRTRFPAQYLVRGFLRPTKIHNAVNILLQRAHAAITDMRTVVVITEENSASHEILGAENCVVGSQNFDPLLIDLWTVPRASAVS